jgi:hypothetical protein
VKKLATKNCKCRSQVQTAKICTLHNCGGALDRTVAGSRGVDRGRWTLILEATKDEGGRENAMKLMRLVNLFFDSR